MNVTKNLITTQLLFVCLFPIAGKMAGGWLDLLEPLGDIITLMMLIQLMCAYSNRIPVQVVRLKECFIFLFIYATAVSLIKQQGVLPYIWGVRHLFRFGVLFLTAVRYLRVEDIGYYIRLLDRIVYINLGVAGFMFLALGMKGDVNSGTFNENGSLAMLCLICMSTTLSRYGEGKINLRRTAINMVCVMVLSALAEIKFLYYMIPLNIGLLVMLNPGRKRMIPLLAAGCMVGIIGFFSISSIYGSKYTRSLVDTSTLQSYTMTEGQYNLTKDGINRGTVISSVEKHLFTGRPLEKWIGFGIGSGSASGHLNTPIYMRFGKRLSYHYFLISYLLIELGWIGLISYLAIHLQMLRLALNIRINGYVRNMNIMMMVNLLVTMLYNNSVITEVAYPAYLVMAMPYILLKERRYEENKSECHRTCLQC